LYVDKATGNDTHDGTTWAKCVRTLAKVQALAAADANVSTIYVKGGSQIYRRAQALSTVNKPTQSLNWIADGGTVNAWYIEDAATWTQNGTYTNVWQYNRSTVVQIVSLETLESDGTTPKKLVQKTSLANCAGAITAGVAGHWYTDGTVVYVQMPNGLSPVAPSERVYVTLSGSNSIQVGNGATQYFDNWSFFGSGFSIGAVTGSYASTRSIVLRNCTSMCSYGDGLSTERISHVYMQNCTSKYNAADGFSTHYTGTANYTRAVFEGCVSTENGTDDGAKNDNGYTTHEATACVLCNCSANGSWGPTNAHVSAGQQLWALGCSSNNCHDGTSAGWYCDGTAWLDSCSSSGCVYDRQLAATAAVYCYQFTGGTGSDYVATGGTLGTYTPS
jgi:hypothetical protein